MHEKKTLETNQERRKQHPTVKSVKSKKGKKKRIPKYRRWNKMHFHLIVLHGLQPWHDCSPLSRHRVCPVKCFITKCQDELRIWVTKGTCWLWQAFWETMSHMCFPGFLPIGVIWMKRLPLWQTSLLHVPVTHLYAGKEKNLHVWWCFGFKNSLEVSGMTFSYFLTEFSSKAKPLLTLCCFSDVCLSDKWS